MFPKAFRLACLMAVLHGLLGKNKMKITSIALKAAP